MLRNLPLSLSTVFLFTYPRREHIVLRISILQTVMKAARLPFFDSEYFNNFKTDCIIPPLDSRWFGAKNFMFLNNFSRTKAAKTSVWPSPKISFVPETLSYFFLKLFSVSESSSPLEFKLLFDSFSLLLTSTLVIVSGVDSSVSLFDTIPWFIFPQCWVFCFFLLLFVHL